MNPEGAASPPPPAVRVGAGRRVVLVVDDEEAMRELLAALLSRWWKVHTAADASEAERILALHRVDVILCDQVLPGEDGLSFVTRVHEARPDLPVILVTGHYEPELLLRAINEGHVFRYLVKPVKSERLLGVVEEALLRVEEVESHRLLRELAGDGRLGVLKASRALERLSSALVTFAHSFSFFFVVVCLVVFVMGCGTLFALYFLKISLGIDIFKDVHLRDLLPFLPPR